MPAPTFTNLTANGASSATSFNTASVSPTGNRLIIVSVHAYINAGSVAPSAPSVTGNGITYSLLHTQDVDTAGTDRATVFVYIGMAASPSSGAITISFGATTMTRCVWVVDQSDANVATTGTNGADAIVQHTGLTSASVSSQTISYTQGFPGTSTMYAVFAHQTNVATTPRASWTEIADTIPVTLASLETQYFTGSDTAASASWGTAARTGGVVLEVAPTLPGPTITPFEVSSWTTTTTPKTITLTGALNGDLIVVQVGGDNNTTGTGVTAVSYTTTGGTTGSWTTVSENLSGTSHPWVSAAWANVTADGDVTVSIARTQSSGAAQWGGWAGLAHNHGGVGVTANSAPSATETVSLAGITQDSAICMIAIDWDALAVVAFSPAAGANSVEATLATNVTNYAAYWRAQNSGTRGYGIGTSSTTNLGITAVEILAASTAKTGDATLSVTDSITAGGAATGSASVATTASITAAGSVSGGSFTGSASRATTASITATGNMAAAGSAVRVTTATITPAGAATASASIAATATISAAGNVATSSGASLAITAATIASSQPGAGASIAVTDSITAAGNLAASGSASRATTASITTAGNMAAAGSAAVATTASITAAGNLAASGGAALAVTAAVSAAAGANAASTTTVAISATGAVTAASGATLTVTTTLTTAGNRGSGATFSATATISAAGRLGTSQGATQPVSVTITAAGAASYQKTAALVVAATIAAIGEAVVPPQGGTATSAVGAHPRASAAAGIGPSDIGGEQPTAQATPAHMGVPRASAGG